MTQDAIAVVEENYLIGIKHLRCECTVFYHHIGFNLLFFQSTKISIHYYICQTIFNECLFCDRHYVRYLDIAENKTDKNKSSSGMFILVG